MRPNQNGSAVLRGLQDIVASCGNQAAAHKRDIRQFVNCGKFANSYPAGKCRCESVAAADHRLRR